MEINSKVYCTKWLLCKMGAGKIVEIQNFESLHDKFGARAPRISSSVTSFAHMPMSNAHPASRVQSALVISGTHDTFSCVFMLFF
jgi:hypothetical protein